MSAIGMGRALSALHAASRALREAQASDGVLLTARTLIDALQLGVRGQGGLVDLWFQAQEGQLSLDARSGLEGYLFTLAGFSRVRAWRREFQTASCIATHDLVIREVIRSIEEKPQDARAILIDPDGSWALFLGQRHAA